jgi:hypothetical protein
MARRGGEDTEYALSLGGAREVAARPIGQRSSSTHVRVGAEEHVDRVGVEPHDRIDLELAASSRTCRRRDVEHRLHVLRRGADQPVDLARDIVGPQLAVAGEAVGRAASAFRK